jgi:putative DNA primase/helicase
MRINHSLERGAKALDQYRIGAIAADYAKDHNRAALAVINELGAGNLINTDGRIHFWNKECWKEESVDFIKQRVIKLLSGSKFSSASVSSITELVKIHTLVPGHQFNKPVTDEIPVKNGVLVISSQKVILRPHRREDYRTIVCNVNYDPRAKAPRFERFLSEIFNGCPDAEARKRVLVEALAYALMSTCRYETFFIFIGAGANGKSVFLKLVIAMIGPENVAAVQPSQFENQFQRAHLQGKLVNVISEIAEGAEINDAQLKSLVSGELTTAERKFAAPFNFHPIATHFFATNHLPHTRDFSDALFRRAIVLEFPNKFEGAARDPKLNEILERELPGVLNLALDGARRLLKNGAFTIPPSSTIAANQWRLEADQAAQFLCDVCERDIGSSERSSDLYEQYQKWAKANGIHKALNQKNFSTRLIRLGLKQSRVAGGQRVLVGVRIAHRQTGSLVT